MRADLGVWLGFIYLFGNIIKSFGRLHVHIESFKFSKTVDERYGCGGCTAILRRGRGGFGKACRVSGEDRGLIS